VFYDIPIYEAFLKKAVSTILNELNLIPSQSGQSLCVSATGAHGIIEAHKDPNFKFILQQFYWNLPDGMPLVWWGRLKGYSQMNRCYGPDFFADIMKATSKMEVAHFFCGGKPGVVKELKLAAELKWGNKNVKGIYGPPFSPMVDTDWEELVSKIKESYAQIVWIGLGTPKQEKFAFELAKRVNVKFIITIGAAFDFHTGRLAQAPQWMQRTGFEWLFRLFQEPRRLWKRYFEIVPKFFILAGVDLMNHYLRKRT